MVSTSNPDQSEICSLKVTISGITHKLVLPDEDNIPLDQLSCVDGYVAPTEVYVSPFDEIYLEECGYGTLKRSERCYSSGHLYMSEEEAHSDSSCPSSPINVSSGRKKWHQRSHKSPLTQRESLLEKAWERKRELYEKEFANFQECSNLRMLGRSSSDCSKPMRGIGNHASLGRSLSDCGEPYKDPIITPSRCRTTLTRSLTDDDFEELKGCLDLGFRFDKRSIPDLYETLPALEAVSAVTQTFQDSLTASPAASSEPSPSPSWSVTRPGDSTEEVKEKLRHWAQAVACSARLCH